MMWISIGIGKVLEYKSLTHTSHYGLMTSAQIIRSKKASYIAVAAESKPNNGDNLNSIKREIIGNFRNKVIIYYESKINALEIKSWNKNTREELPTYN
jgi:hypothetical protein